MKWRILGGYTFILILLMSAVVIVASCSKLNTIVDMPATTGHHCPYTNCPFEQGQLTFDKGCGECEQGEDCWKLDSIHFVHPLLDYDDCDDLLTQWQDGRVHIIQQQKDSRGLTSIVFIQDRDTFALDYLNEGELDSLRSIHQ